MNQKVAIIILNWNNYLDTIKCVNSVQKSSYTDYEIIVVDNGSTNNSVANIRKQFSDIHIIQTGSNLGYSGGNNAGIKYALKQGADLVWILNPDTVIDSNTLGELAQAIKPSDVGLAVPKIYYQDEPKKVWFADSFLKLKTGQADHLHYNQIDEGQFDQKIALDWAPGTSMLIKREVLEKAGLFDERYFLFYEDVDLCVRVRRAGFKIIFAPKAKIWHEVGSTVGTGNPNNEYYKTRNRFYFVRKFNPLLWWVGFTTVFGLKLIARVAKSKFMGKNEEFARADWEGFTDHLNNNYGIRK